MPRSIKYDIPGTDWRVRAEEIETRGLAAVFGRQHGALPPLVVDVGFGRGEFLLELAEKAPETPFLGLEVSFKRVLKMARRLARSELANVRLVEGPAERVLELLPEACVGTFWINFPDPWPKKRHHRRRLIQPALLGLLAGRLVPGGLLHVATDHSEYAEQIGQGLSAAPELENLYGPEPFLREVADRSPTAYEREWRAEGRSLHFFAYRRAPASAAG